MAFSQKAARQVSPGKGAHCESTEHGAICRLDIGSGGQPFLKRRIDCLSHVEAFSERQVSRDSAEAHTVDLDPHRFGAARIGIERGYSRDVHRLVVGFVAWPGTHSEG